MITIKIKDLPSDIRDIAEDIGLEPLLRIVSRIGGDSIYVPTMDSLERQAVSRAVVKEYDGGNIKELAKKYRKTVPGIRYILNNSIEK